MKHVLERVLAPIEKNAAEYAERLCKRFGDIYTLAAATDAQIADVIDGKMSTVLYIRLAIILSSRRVCDAFAFGKKHTEQELGRLFTAQLLNMPTETLIVLSLDADGRPIALDFAGEGTVSLSAVLPRKIIEIATRRGAKSVILAHNHPRGYARPSDDDVRSTHSLFSVLFAAGVTLQSHYVIAANQYEIINCT